ncbi:MAG TPA: helix-turn-helix transcriptional regulator [Jiangellaceae bacterium]
MKQPEGWGPKLVQTIAGEIRRHRTRKKISAQELSNRCAKLGWPIKRSVLSNLESGYRETITVPELLIIAAALEVPPLLLMLPAGYAERVEILPGRVVETMEALRWIVAENALSGDRWGDVEQSTVHSLFVHEQNVVRWKNSRMFAADIRAGIGNGDAEGFDEIAATAEQGLRSLRQLMRVRGLTPPDLPPELALAIDEKPA